jgi:hypothetical protein
MEEEKCECVRGTYLLDLAILVDITAVDPPFYPYLSLSQPVMYIYVHILCQGVYITTN